MANVRDFLEEGPFHLALSIGWFGFFTHAGLLTALEELELSPRSVSGASSGAIVASAYASGLSAEEVADVLFRTERREFWDPGFGWGLLRGAKLRALLADRFPTSTFEAARLPLQLSTWSTTRQEVEVLEAGDLPSAVHASVAVQPLFMPARRDEQTYIDVAYRDPFAVAGVDSSRRLFVHDLCSREKPGLDHAKERGAAFRSLRFAERMKMGPFRLKHGRRAFDEGYRHAMKVLNASTSSPTN